MAKGKNTFVDFELESGETVKMTLAFYLLLGLKQHRKDIYDRYNQIMVKGPKEELESITILYAAYLCAYIQGKGTADGAMPARDFMVECGSDREAVMSAVAALTRPKRKAASESRS